MRKVGELVAIKGIHKLGVITIDGAPMHNDSRVFTATVPFTASGLYHMFDTSRYAINLIIKAGNLCKKGDS